MHRRQPGSALCFVCGTENPHGLGAVFYDDGARVFTELTPAAHHQGWPGALHGGNLEIVLGSVLAAIGAFFAWMARGAWRRADDDAERFWAGGHLAFVALLCWMVAALAVALPMWIRTQAGL